MKKIIFSLIILVGASSVYADANLAMEDNLYKKYADESKSHFQILGDLFKNSSALDIKKLVGVAWAGRCFSRSNPNAASNSAFFLRVARKDDTGPIGRDKEKTYEATTGHWNPSEEPNYFDIMTFDEITNGINHLLRKVYFYNNSIIRNYNNSTKKRYLELKISGKYLIKEVSYRTVPNSYRTIKKSTYKATERCYYFIPKYRKK